eukprot:SAG31_NODE_24619_length_477_cov_14.277778_1_plen_79_part_10
MAISLIEDITRLPTRDADIGLLAALGEIDTWDYEELRNTMYVQSKQLQQNAVRDGHDTRKSYHFIFVHLSVALHFRIR